MLLANIAYLIGILLTVGGIVLFAIGHFTAARYMDLGAFLMIAGGVILTPLAIYKQRHLNAHDQSKHSEG